jgi:hypothetical protein
VSASSRWVRVEQGFNTSLTAGRRAPSGRTSCPRAR